MLVGGVVPVVRVARRADVAALQPFLEHEGAVRDLLAGPRESFAEFRERRTMQRRAGGMRHEARQIRRRVRERDHHGRRRRARRRPAIPPASCRRRCRAAFAMTSMTCAYCEAVAGFTSRRRPAAKSSRHHRLAVRPACRFGAQVEGEDQPVVADRPALAQRPESARPCGRAA